MDDIELPVGQRRRFLAEGPKITENAELSKAPAATPVVGVWRTLKGFILWSHERGTIQYDVMVTLILVFVFFSPHFIDFNDHVVQRIPHPSDIIVSPDGSGGFVYQVEGKAIQGGDDATVRTQLLRIIEPIAGEISIQHFEPVTDKRGNIVAYKAWVRR